LGTNGLQQAIDSLSAQVNRLSSNVGRMSSGSQTSGAATRVSGTNNLGSSWNAASNRANYSSNGGGGRFTGGALGRSSPNGGGGNFGNLMGMSRMSAAGGAVMGVASSLVSYANKNMSTNMQMDYFGTQQAIAGGFSNGNFQGANAAARAAVFNNNYAALSATDAAKSGYINQYTFGAAQFNGSANPAFVSGMRQAGGFAYANPTQGAYGGALAAQQTFSARSAMVAPALGLASPYLAGGVKNSMGNIAQSIMQRTFGGKGVTNKQFSASISQGGSLDVNLQYFGNQLGWSQGTIQEYRNVLQGQVAAQNNGMSTNKYYNLLGQASGGNKSAINQLAKSTGMGTSMFENQRNLNATRLTRQNDILNSLAPAFDKATQVVNKFSEALTSFLKSTGLDKAIGAGAGTLAPVSNALSGMSSGLGAGLGLFGAARFLGGSGGLGGLFGRGGASASGGLINATRGAGGAYNITSLGGGASTLGSLTRTGGVLGGVLAGGYALSKVAPTDPTGHSTSGEGFGTWMKNTFSWQGVKNTFNVKDVLDGKHNSVKTRWSDRTTPTDGISGGSVEPTGSSSSKGTSSGTNSGANAAQVIGYAEQQLGDPYVWGGTGPNGWDCSGLTQWAFGQAGVKIPRVASAQQKIGKPVDTDKTQPGDLLFNGNPAHHVVMAIGGGKIIEAPRTGLNVRIRSFKPGEFTNARRILGSVGNMNSLANSSNDSATTLNDTSGNSGGDIGGVYGGTSELEAIMSALGGGISAGSAGLSAQTSSSSTATTSTTTSAKSPSSNNRKDLQSYAKKLLQQHGWSSQWNDFNALEMSEAGWNPKATNPSSGAYGLAQALPKEKYSSAGSDWKTNGGTQLRWMMDYIQNRYGSPAKAWSFHQRNNWYDKGAWDIDKDQPATVHKGEMIIPAQQAETIRQTLLNNTFNPNLQKAAGTGSNGAIQFGDINVHMPSTYSGSAQDARAAGKMVAEAIAEQLRLKNLQTGQ
jgi:cell wall-associated NlpC family hydrolase